MHVGSCNRAATELQQSAYVAYTNEKVAARCTICLYCSSNIGAEPYNEFNRDDSYWAAPALDQCAATELQQSCNRAATELHQY